MKGRQILECSELVKVGKNCVIDPQRDHSWSDNDRR